MNKLIRDLAEQSGYIPGETTSEAFNEFRFDTFVELIVNEALACTPLEVREKFGIKK